jgi:hypothetical protein
VTGLSTGHLPLPDTLSLSKEGRGRDASLSLLFSTFQAWPSTSSSLPKAQRREKVQIWSGVLLIGSLL